MLCPDTRLSPACFQTLHDSQEAACQLPLAGEECVGYVQRALYALLRQLIGSFFNFPQLWHESQEALSSWPFNCSKSRYPHLSAAVYTLLRPLHLGLELESYWPWGSFETGSSWWLAQRIDVSHCSARMLTWTSQLAKNSAEFRHSSDRFICSYQLQQSQSVSWALCLDSSWIITVTLNCI